MRSRSAVSRLVCDEARPMRSQSDESPRRSAVCAQPQRRQSPPFRRSAAGQRQQCRGRQRRTQSP
eukprot:9306320-Lingulodinium_polyedra.AAC.1